MSSTNKTKNLELSQFIASDKPAWLTDYNNDMEKIDTGIAASTPTGCVLPFAGALAPDGFLICDGQEVSKDEYKNLFAVIGTTYGEGSTASTFKVPNMTNRFPLGYDANLGAIGGEESHKLEVEELPRLAAIQTTSTSATYGAQYQSIASGWKFAAAGDAVGSTAMHNNMPPYISLAFIIKT